MKMTYKILLSFIITGIIGFTGLLLTVIIYAIGRDYLNTSLAALSFLAIIFFSLSYIWNWFSRKTRTIAASIIFGCIIATGAVSFGLDFYDSKIEVIDDRDFNLTIYKPFAEDTKAVSLDEESELKMINNLPRIDGATALYPLYSAFVRATYPKADYNPYDYSGKVICSSTAYAYDMLIKGENDIIFAAEPSEEQLEAAKAAGVELKLTPIGREAFVFFVNSKNPVNELSTSDIKKIYSGNALNWKEFGGKNKEIRAFQRPVNSGSQTMLLKFMGNTKVMEPPKEDVVNFMGGILEEVSAYKNYDNAIGYSFLFFATEMVKDDKIKLLSINGTAPTRENLSNGKYPYSSEFYAVTAGTENKNAQRLIDWILSPQGQEIIEKTGYTPIDN